MTDDLKIFNKKERVKELLLPLSEEDAPSFTYTIVFASTTEDESVAVNVVSSMLLHLYVSKPTH